MFDVADTHPVRGARMPYLWELKDEHHAAVLDTLVRRYGETESRDIGQAQEQIDRIVVDLKKQNNVDEAMKASDQMEWVQSARFLLLLQ
ncbi:MAG: TnpV protein [Oscillospiraceae bacterium]|nr:TnpV protein [Oscillospiraceae bacterium]